MMRADKSKECLLINNRIGADGCFHLTKAKWPRLSSIDLSNNTLTNDGIQLGRKDVVIYPKRTEISLAFIYVIDIRVRILQFRGRRS